MALKLWWQEARINLQNSIKKKRMPSCSGRRPAGQRRIVQQSSLAVHEFARKNTAKIRRLFSVLKCSNVPDYEFFGAPEINFRCTIFSAICKRVNSKDLSKTGRNLFTFSTSILVPISSILEVKRWLLGKIIGWLYEGNHATRYGALRCAFGCWRVFHRLRWSRWSYCSPPEQCMPMRGFPRLSAV